MRKPIRAVSDLLACPRHQACRERTRGCNGHLLAENGAHGAFERIPRAGNAQPRPPLRQWREKSIRPESERNSRRVGGQVECTPRCAGKLKQRRGHSAAHPQLESILSLKRSNGHDSVSSARTHRSRVAAVIDALHAG